VLVQNIPEELQRQRVIGLTEKSLVHLLQQRYVGKRCVTKRSACARRCPPRRTPLPSGVISRSPLSDLAKESSVAASTMGSRSSTLHYELLGYVVQILSTAVIVEQFKVVPRCRPGRECGSIGLWSLGRPLGRGSGFQKRLCHELVDVVHIQQERGGALSSRLR